jgi:anti-sigma regulatory factor (Ser/Thr protein kinase)
MADQTKTNGQRSADTSFTALEGTVATHSHDPGSALSLSFARGPMAACAAREALATLDQRLDGGKLDDIRLLVSELVTNAIRHAGAPTGGVVALDVSINGPKVRVEVADAGTGFDPTPRADEMTKPGGWGLYLVDRIADRWGIVRNHMNRVWFEVDLA